MDLSTRSLAPGDGGFMPFVVATTLRGLGQIERVLERCLDSLLLRKLAPVKDIRHLDAGQLLFQPRWTIRADYPRQRPCMTYGDGVSDVDIADRVLFHEAHGRRATMTAVQPPARFGAVSLDGDQVTSFREKLSVDRGFINGGFFVLDPDVVDLVQGDDPAWETAPLERLSESGEWVAFRHTGFWQPMDTLREKNLLEDLWESGEAPWKK